MSHNPVSRIIDVLSVGQQLSVMCIGRDLRGNVKVSLIAVEGSGLTCFERSSSTSNPVGCNASVIDSTSNFVSDNSNNCLENQDFDRNEISLIGSSSQENVNSLYSSEPCNDVEPNADSKSQPWQHGDKCTSKFSGIL